MSTPGRSRRLTRRLLLGAAAVLILEGMSWVVHRAAFRESFSFAKAAELRRQRIGEALSPDVAAAGGAPTFMVPHPYVGFVLDPVFDRYRVPPHVVPVSEWGFRDDKIPIQRRSGHQLIVGVFGGSLAFWMSVHGVAALAEELSRSPAAQGREVVVVRTGLGGLKQPQQLMTLTYLLALGGQFDIVVNLDGFNEVALAPRDQVPRGLFPFFPRGWPDLLGEQGDPARVLLVGRVLHLQSMAGERAATFSRAGARHSIFATTLWRLLDRRLAQQLAAARAALDGQVASATRARPNFATTGPPRPYRGEEEMYEDLARVWHDASLQMDALCRANGIHYFHFLQPNQHFDGGKPMNAAEREAAMEETPAYGPHVRAAYPLLRRGGRDLVEREVAFLDLTRVFAGLEQPLYVDSCCHVSEEGYRILGRAIGRSIADRIHDPVPR